MNSTRWHTLSGFVQWLGKSSICNVDMIEEEWHITYIDRDPETLERQRKADKKKKMDRDDEERLLDFIEHQVEKGKKDGEVVEEPEKFSELIRDSEEDKIKLDLKVFKKPDMPTPMIIKKEYSKSVTSSSSSRSRAESTYSTTSSSSSSSSSSKPGKRKALDEIMELEEQKKEKMNRKDYWLVEGIVVKLVSKSLGEKNYKQKAVVLEVIDKYRAKVKMIESGEKFKVDQVRFSFTAN